MRVVSKRLCMVVLSVLVIFLSACGNNSSATNGKAKPNVIIGSKNFTEQFILGEMYAQALEAQGYQVKKKLNLGGTSVAFEALKKGDIDLYPEYTGTALMDQLGHDPIYDTNEVYNTVKAELKKQFDIDVLEPTPFSNTYVMVVTSEAAKKYDLRSLSDLSVKAPEIRFAAIPEFVDRADTLPNMKKVYGGFEFKSMKLYDIGLRYKALASGEADATNAFATDGQIAGYGLVTLVEDKKLWPDYHVAPQVRGAFLKDNPEVGEIINNINKLLTAEVMSSLNWKVDGDKKEEPAAVAKAFLKEHGFLN